MTRIKRTIYAALLLTLAILLASAICACSKKVYVPVERTRTVTDSTFIHRADSLTRLLHTRDTLIVRDSIVTRITGDTIYKEAWRTRDRVSIIRDTVRIGNGFELQQLHRDTIREPQIVEVEKEVVKEVEKKPPWWKRALQYTGGVALILLMLWIAAKAILRRFIPKI